jgi:Tol biopolymer transport system component
MGRLFAFLFALALAALLATGLAGASAGSQNGKIALMLVSDGRAEIGVVGSDGSASASLTSAGVNAEPAWSPDGTKLAYSCGNFSLCLMNADGSGSLALTDTAAGLARTSTTSCPPGRRTESRSRSRATAATSSTTASG